MPRSVGVAVMTKPTEAQCQQAIVAAAKLGGWLVHAERPAPTQSGKWSTPIQGHKGFPDLVLISPDHRTIIIAELKRRPNKVTAEQVTWLDAFSDFARFHEIEPLPGAGERHPATALTVTTWEVRARQEWLQLWGLHVCVWYVPEEQDAICTALAAGRVP